MACANMRARIRACARALRVACGVRSPLLILTLVALTTFACKREEDTTAPADSTATTSDTDSSSTPPTTTDEAEPNADSLEACTHMGKLMAASLGDAVEITEEEQAANALQCAKDIDLKRASMPPEAWETWRTCAMAAQTVEEAVACG
jgi:hypothetical protein